MKKYDPRLWIGGLMVLGGILLVLENLHILSNVGGIFWGAIFGLVGFYFIYLLNRDPNYWWAAFPGFTFLGMSVASLLPNSLDGFGGLAFLGAIGIAFLWVYFKDTAGRWWAIIPGGTLITLGLISALDQVSGTDNGSFLFLGLGITFILVAVLPGGRSRSWAMIPGVILLAFGSLLGFEAVGVLEYLWPAVLIILGGYFVLKFFRNPASQ